MTRDAVRTVLALHAAIFLALVGGWLFGGGFEFAGVSDNAWWTPFLVINVGVFLGNVIMLTLAAHPSAEHAIWLEGRRQDLFDSRRIVVQQLRQLEAEKDKLSAEDYARERAALLAVGTQASRQLQEHFTATGDPTVVPRTVVTGMGWTAEGPHAGAPTSPASVPPTLGPPDALAMRLRLERDSDPQAFAAAMKKLGYGPGAGTSGEIRGAMYTLAVFGVIAVLYTMASQDARTRTEGMGMTGGDGVASPSAREPSAAPPTNPALAGLQARLQANPNDLEALNQLTESALLQEDMATALDMNNRARKVNPDDPDANVFHGVLLAMIDRREEAFVILDGILETHPKHLRALVWRSLLAMGDNPTLAISLMERAVAIDPDPRLKDLLASARRRAGSAAPAPTPPPATNTPSVLVAGTIELADGVVGDGQVIFASLKAPEGGPPLASVRLPPGPFPLLFEITTKNILAMGGVRPIPERVVLTVRLDSDGDPMSRPDSDPHAIVEDTVPGTTGLMLSLQ